jgi:hypothetical protein
VIILTIYKVEEYVEVAKPQLSQSAYAEIGFQTKRISYG